MQPNLTAVYENTKALETVVVIETLNRKQTSNTQGGTEANCRHGGLLTKDRLKLSGNHRSVGWLKAGRGTQRKQRHRNTEMLTGHNG